jgi:DNA-binding NtrC family response regulator
VSGTRRFGERSTFAVRTLRADVVEGPDSGRSTHAGDERLTLGTADGNDLVLGDDTVSRFHALLRRTEEGILVVDQRSTNGTWVGSARLGQALVAPGTVLQLGRTRVRVSEGKELAVDLHEGDALGPLRGRSPAMRRVMAWVERAAATEAPVLLVGESGTGKEVVARAIHEGGPRAGKPFVVVDCGALTPTLVASELFGHERGSFTGADRQHAGALEQAHGGTLFLDEIGELPRELQPVLLGALERRAFRRVGGRGEVHVDVRILAATNRDLRSDVNGGAFRLDLYYRLAVLQLELPALRDRQGDIPILLEHFLRELGYRGEVAQLFPDGAMRVLLEHRWPGNVRELRNVAQATLALGESSLIAGREGTASAANGAAPAAHEDPTLLSIAGLLALPYKDARQQALGAFEARYLARLLERTGGNVSQAAREAGLDRSYLFSLLRRTGLR